MIAIVAEISAIRVFHELDGSRLRLPRFLRSSPPPTGFPDGEQPQSPRENRRESGPRGGILRRSRRRSGVLLAVLIVVLLSAAITLGVARPFGAEANRTTPVIAPIPVQVLAHPAPPEMPTLQGALRECDGEQEECVREFVGKVAPRAEYAGGRTEVDATGSGQNHSVLYFEDPAMEPCEYEQPESGTSGATTSYTVVIAGKGSFAPERDCIPEL